MNKNKTFLIIDGNSVAHRAFHALPVLTNKKNQQINAVYGFVLALFRAVGDFHPDYLAVCFDTKAPTFRHLEFKSYKAQRPETAAELVPQLEIIQKLLADLGVAVFAKDGFEADDLIASVIKSARQELHGEMVDFYVLTGDHDSLQLVGQRVKAFIINRGVKNAVLYDAIKVKEMFGVAPAQIPALKAIAGDSSDNIPGAPGIGSKGAVEILEKCGNLKNALNAAQKNQDNSCLKEMPRFKKIKKILLENKEKIINFQKLATMRDDAPLENVLRTSEFANFPGVRAKEALLDLGLASLAKRLPQENTCRNGTLF